MFIVYIGFGVVAGIIAALFTWFSGGSLFMAVIAYVLAGIAGMLASILWEMAPRSTSTVKQTATRRG